LLAKPAQPVNGHDNERIRMLLYADVHAEEAGVCDRMFDYADWLILNSLVTDALTDAATCPHK
jgi:hypothetical protein